MFYITLEREDSQHIWPEFCSQALNASSQAFADIGNVIPFAKAYGADVDDLYHELHQGKCLLQRMKFEDRPTT